MKHILILNFFLAIAIAAEGQCTATQHNMSGGSLTFHPEWVTSGHGEKMYAEEDMCDYEGWALVWEDDFNLGYLDQTIWEAGWQGGPDDPNNEGAAMPWPPGPGSNNANYSVSSGILSLTTTYDGTPTSPNYRKAQNPGIVTKRQFPSGKVIIKVKMPAITSTNIDEAPLWMRSILDYTDRTDPNHPIANGAKQYYANEMDIELMGNTRSQGTYTLHDGVHDVPNERGYDDGAPGTSCYGGDISDGNWHLVEIEWDMWHVNWWVDGTLVNSLARTYADHWEWFWFFPVPFVDYYQEVSECNGPQLSGYYHRDWMFPLFANFPITLSGLAAYGGLIDGSALPYTVQIDYVKFYRKVKCNKNLVLPPSDLNPTGGYRSAGGIGCDRSGGDQVPPTLDNQTPSVITAGTITVGKSDGSVPYIFRRDDYDKLTQQNLDLLATESVTLLPGFETDLLYQANGPCSLPPYGPHMNSGTVLGNNWTIQDVFTAGIIDCPPASKELDIMNSPTNEAPIKITSPPAIVNFNVSLYPNPATNQCTVKFSMPDDADVTITLTDMMGRDIATIDHSWHNQGTSLVPFSTDSYASGVYLVRFTDGTNTSMQRLTIAQKD